MVSLKITNSEEDCSFTVALVGLDQEYSHDGRTFKCEIRRSGTTEYYRTFPDYSGTIAAYAPGVDASQPIVAMSTDSGIVVNDLQPYTLYDIRITISNIEGHDDVVLETLNHKTGYGDIPGIVPSVDTPQVVKFTAQQSSLGAKKIKYSIKVTNLSKTNENTGTASGVHITCYDLNGKEVDTDKYYSGEDYTGNILEESSTFTVSEYGVYTIKLYALNFSDKTDDKELTKYITVEVKGSLPNCKLTVSYINKEYYYDNGRVKGMIRNYPVIAYNDWNQFCNDINLVRIQAGLSVVTFITLREGTEMSVDIFNQAANAIAEIYEHIGVVVPLELETEKRRHQEMTPEYFKSLEDAIVGIRDTLSW